MLPMKIEKLLMISTMVLIFFLTGTYAMAQSPLGINNSPVILGIPLGASRTKIKKLFSTINIKPKLQKGSIDVFPRAIVKNPYLSEVWLLYTREKLSKIMLKFDVPIDLKDQTGEPIFTYYTKLRKYLIQLYGQPTNTTSYINPNFHYKLVALETGNAYFFDYWENAKNMRVLLYLKGKEKKIDFSLVYEYIPLSEK